MKTLLSLILICLVFSHNAHAQGTSCASPINLVLDGVLRNYPASASTGNNVLCTSNGTTPVTWFRLTTNSMGECPLINITASDSAACEVAFYTSCTSMLTSSSMCFYNGYGLWAPNENFLTGANTTYYLRVKTNSACTIKIAAQNYTPQNGNCLGAISLIGNSTNDNNACNHADMSITPSQLCAFTLENTAWYQFYVASTGYSIITINNIHCDNGAANNNSGFQLGFFTGSCSSLQWVNCANGSGPTVQATTEYLPAGTKVFLAIDGVSGANCSYSISGLNTTGVLSGTLKNFSGWKTPKSNILQWTTDVESGKRYVIERSEDGIKFFDIGQVQSGTKSQLKTSYSFEDLNPPFQAFYRLRHVDQQGQHALSETIKINRNGLTGLNIYVVNPVPHTLQVKMETDLSGSYSYQIVNTRGQILLTGIKKLETGTNHFSIPVANLAAGQYYLSFIGAQRRVSSSFIKN